MNFRRTTYLAENNQQNVKPRKKLTALVASARVFGKRCNEVMFVFDMFAF